MINKRLLSYLKEDKKYIYYQVAMQWLSLLGQIGIVLIMANMIDEVFNDNKIDHLLVKIMIIILLILVKGICSKQATMFSFQASKKIKDKLRIDIYQKVLALNNRYQDVISMASLTQLILEGVEQLEIYYGKYLPQFIYSIIAPITLFVVLKEIDFKAALILFVCVPLIPLSIVLVQKIAKKLLHKYWGLYGNLANRFLDNVSGLTTLKGYGGDQNKHKEMNEEASRFRYITMKVLVMQLNSISIMDLVAYGGAALGIILALNSYYQQHINLHQAFMMVMLSAEFFIPLRLLGSFFHIAMNGNAASDKMFKLLDVPTIKNKGLVLDDLTSIKLNHVSFGYDQKLVLHDLSLSIDQPGIYGLVGKSGSGKSTITKLLLGYYNRYQGSITYNGINITDLNHQSIMKHVTLVGHDSILFSGSVRSNLLDGNIEASDEMMINVLKQVNLWDYFNQIDGLESKIEENAHNLSGGQKQRLALARALLHDSRVYIFDEATSNIDRESETIILNLIESMKDDKIVLLISHRLANIFNCQCIYVFNQGYLSGCGLHEQLMENNDEYYHLVMKQREIENYGGSDG